MMMSKWSEERFALLAHDGIVTSINDQRGMGSKAPLLK
jgi:hypothetical protein